MKTLKEVFGFEDKAKKVSSKELRNLILREIRSLKEEKEDSPELPEEFKNPNMDKTPADGKGNIKDVDASEIVAQMLSGDPKAPVIVAMGAFHNPKFTPDLPNKVSTPEGAKDLQKWVLSKGPAFLKNNIATVQNALPSAGLDKSKMPALEPDDVSSVKDALEPGGEFNIDMAEPLAGNEKSVEKWWEETSKEDSDEQKNEAVQRAVTRILEAQFPQNYPDGMPGGGADPKGFALAFLTKGLKDGDPSDDNIQVKENEPVSVAEMIPTQQNIQLGKSLAFALGGGFGGQNMDAFITGGNEILDGHHRWSGTMIVDPGASIKGHKIFAPAKDIIPAMTALGNALGNSQKGRPEKETQKESVNKDDDILLERWSRLAGLNG